MVKKIYVATGITSAGVSAITVDQRIFRNKRYVATNPSEHSVASNSNPIYGDNGRWSEFDRRSSCMMDSHIYKKAANRLPAMAGITIVRFNTRGTSSEAGTSTGVYDNGDSEKFDVEAMINYCFDTLKIEELWVCGWSFGTDLAIRHARDSRIKGLILLSPPLKYSAESDLDFWVNDSRTITALIPEFDDYLRPEEARARFAKIKHMKLIAVDGGKHLWVGEPAVHRVLTEITRVIAPERLPLTQEIDD
jgi:alpha/beta superfamily hydrolase